MKKNECLKKLFYLASLAGIGLFFNGCIAGYVVTEPSYSVVIRPPQPSHLHFWVDGDWRWNNLSHRYVKNPGYWEKPRQSQTYVAGYWLSAPQGKYWEKGRWQKPGNQNSNQHR
jgi:hypothetical protein